jgi:hypothetical protein
MPIGQLYRNEEILLTSSEGIWAHHTSTSGKRAAYGPGLLPFRVHSFVAQNYTTFAYTVAPVVTFWLNSAPGLTATGNYTSIDTITVATGGSGDIGQTYYATPPSLTQVLPGQEIVAEVTTPTASTTVASEAHRLRLLMFVTHDYARPGDNSNMTVSA